MHKYTINYFIKRIGALLILFTAIGFAYQLFIYPSTLKSEGWLLGIGKRCFQNHPDVVYFSASPNASYAPNDTNQLAINQLIQQQLPSLRVQAFDTGAIHAGIFLHALQALHPNQYPKMIVMDLNLRSFSNLWIHSNLENSLQRNLAYYNERPGILNQLATALKNYKYIPYHERLAYISYDEKFKKLPFSDSSQTVKKWIDSLNNRPDCADGIGREFVRNFGFEIDQHNTMLQSYQAIVTWCKKRDIQLYLVILPENLGQMQLKSGKNLSDLCLKNVAYLKRNLHHCNIIDLVNKLDPTYFFESFPTEHYSYFGRKLVADEIVKSILKQK